MTINLRALSTRASGLVDNILDPHHQHHDDTKPGTHGMDPYELLQAITSLKPANSEANLVMDLARAKREVLRAQKALAECLLRENEVLASLLRLRVDTAKNTLDDADMGLGCMRLAFRQHGWSHCPLSAKQCEGDQRTATMREVPNDRVLTIQLD
ncbi:hypothetical protein DEU56DRAFT_761567 [Suillus clintonianus]|uniref:uncharacterized protein n=1 Tax=Suillus clintonianus TaxID=1904413 RepID=UPI001B865DB0|nr:uncharacterized protein DEU56DRAFT_761567 [Suillus clintonianus]KAG2116155.1 hypothetical protein DEU56DRAFT_761567 [Suillus clintonianus]